MGEVIRRTKDRRFIGWYLRYVDSDGRRKQRASHQPTAALARRMLLEIEARVARGKVGVVIEERPQLPVTELFQRFSAEYSRPRIKNLKLYRMEARSKLKRALQASPQLGALPLREVAPVHLDRLRDALARRFEVGTIRTTLTTVSAAFTWAVKQGLVDKNPVRAVELPPAPPSPDDWLTPEEVQRLLATAKQVGKARGLVWQVRQVAVCLGLYLGLRRGEIFGLRWRDIDLESGGVTVARSYAALPKSGKPRHLRIPDELLPILRAWRPLCPVTREGIVCPVRARGSWQPMTSSSGDLRGLDELFRLASCRPTQRPWHALRHTFASNYLRTGGSLTVLQKILGHSEVRTTMQYVHHAPEYLAAEMKRIRY